MDLMRQPETEFYSAFKKFYINALKLHNFASMVQKSKKTLKLGTI